MVAITLEGICVRYGEQRSGRPLALRDLNLDIASGELLVLAGPSGSGKSTVLRTIAGLERRLADFTETREQLLLSALAHAAGVDHDHLGVGEANPNGDPNDKIYNGAIDNGTGLAQLIEQARNEP